MTYAIGSAADDEAGLDMIHHLLVISNINNLFIDCRQVGYWQSINESCPATGPNGDMPGRSASRAVYTALVEENLPRFRSGSRGMAGFSRGGRPLGVMPEIVLRLRPMRLPMDC
jgi:hypothetical protein